MADIDADSINGQLGVDTINGEAGNYSIYGGLIRVESDAHAVLLAPNLRDELKSPNFARRRTFKSVEPIA